LALHDQVNNGDFSAIYQNLGLSHGLGTDLDRFVAFESIANSTVPVL
jgi:hypothetical protein